MIILIDFCERCNNDLLIFILQKQKYPVIHTLIVTKAGNQMNECLNMYTEQMGKSEDGKEKINQVIAKDDHSWLAWRTNSKQETRYTATNAMLLKGREIVLTHLSYFHYFPHILIENNL